MQMESVAGSEDPIENSEGCIPKRRGDVKSHGKKIEYGIENRRFSFMEIFFRDGVSRQSAVRAEIHPLIHKTLGQSERTTEGPDG